VRQVVIYKDCTEMQGQQNIKFSNLTLDSVVGTYSD